jgi:hypothetical protein
MALRAIGLAVLVLVHGCSLVLDPDELTAELADTDGDALGDTGEVLSDGVPDKQIVVEHSGMVACTFDYHLSLTQCPETCAPGWTYVVDASHSTGVGAFSWTFEATGGFRITPSHASGARVVLSIDTPDCLVGGTNMRPFTVIARLATDGGTPELIELPQIGVGQVIMCSGEGSCPDP